MDSKPVAFTASCKVPAPVNGYQTLHHQVAGHAQTPDNKPCFMIDEDGYLLKLVPDKSINEEIFFKKVFTNKEEEDYWRELRYFVPWYYGTVLISGDGDRSHSRYLKLEYLLSKFRQPCVMDIKVGRKTYDPFATEGKIKKELDRYKHQAELGFRISGYKVFRVETGTSEYHDRHNCKDLTPEDMCPTLATFFDLDNVPDRVWLVSVLLTRLRRLLKWFKHQKRAKFFCSSLLIAYDGQRKCYPTTKAINGTCHQDLIEDENQDRNDIVIKMIDFTHTFIDLEIDHFSTSVDQNYIHGLKKLIGVLENIAR